MGVVYRIWDRARQRASTDPKYPSPLTKRPYDLRHAAVSLWLNAGIPATQVAEWAGHSVNVRLRASCIVGQDEASDWGRKPPQQFPTDTRRRPSGAGSSRTAPDKRRRAPDRRFRRSSL